MLTEQEKLEHRRAACRKYHRKNYAKLYAYDQAWRKANPEKIKSYAPRKAEWSRNYNVKNRDKNYARQQAWRKANPEKIRVYYDRANAKRHANLDKYRESQRTSHRNRFFKSLGITVADYDRMFFEQQGRCWICSAESATHKTSPEKRLVVDHDHFDGTIRGLLCQKCNKALGLFNDDLSLVVKAVHYLTKHAKEAVA